jgi:CelD/BcsL family acetyltransferase involved in cellulose biosynthesis
MSDEGNDSTDHYSHSILETPEEIAAEARSWDHIVEEAYGGNPFLTAGWFLLWLSRFTPPRGRVAFVKVLRRGKVAAYFPLLLVPERFHGIEVRALRFAANVYSPVECPVIAPGERSALFDHVARRVLPGLPWTVFLARDLPMEVAGPAELHVALCDAGHDSHLLPGEANWVYSRQNETGEAYLKARDRGLRGRLRQAPKRLGELGQVEVKVVAEDVTDEDIAAYREVYARSWKEPELDADFHPAMMRWAAERGALRLFLLRAGGRPIAAHLWLAHGTSAYAVKFAYDEQHRPRSPGHLLMAGAMERFFDVEDVALVDYLKGDDEYKREWCNRRRQRMSLVAFSRDVRGRAARLLDRELLPWMRRQEALASAKQRASAWLGTAG